jgi:DNA helicase-2/ATP-dependent DNA helicase PcrA
MKKIKLNQKQLEVVKTIEGPVIVLAGPGTGKTQTLAARIAEILKKTDTPPDGILALTFSDAGAVAMKERVVEMIGATGYYVNITTFHSFCSEIIASNREEFVSARDLEPLSDLERIDLFREILDETSWKIIKPFNAPYYYVRALRKAIQDLKREGVGVEDLGEILKQAQNDERNKQKLQELLLVYKKYQEKLEERSRFDFEDMINLVVDKFEEDKEFLLKFQERFLYILVDEFQDTNSAQNRVVELLAEYWKEKANIFVVGDPDQSIYRFQGASLENVLSFEKSYPKAKIIDLEDSYRSSQLILNASNELIVKNKLKIGQKIKPLKKQTRWQEEKIKLVGSASGTVEELFIVQEIKKLIQQGVKPEEIAVIYRNNVDGGGLARMLAREGINFEIEGGMNVLEDFDVNRLLLMLRTISSIDKTGSDTGLFTLMHQPWFELNELEILKLSRLASQKKIDLFEAILDKRQESKALKNWLKQLMNWKKAGMQMTLGAWIEQVMHESGFLQWMLADEGVIEKLNRLNSFFAEVKRLERAKKEVSPDEFLAMIETMKEEKVEIREEDLDIRTKAVRLMTAHRSKGQEFRVVFISRCVDKAWGNNKRPELIKLPEGILEHSDLEKKEKNEDERRLFYVALTRAKEKVYISWAKAYWRDGRKKSTVVSMFVEELGEKFKTKVKAREWEPEKIMKSLFKKDPVLPKFREVEEKAFLEKVVKEMKLSVTGLNTYLKCPYQFKLNNLLRIPRIKERPLVFGTVIHSALEKYFSKMMKEKKKPTKKYLLKQLERALEKEVLTKKELKELRGKGKRILGEYFDNYYNSWEKPLMVEQFFGYGWAQIYLDDIPLVGKVDKVELIDQKTRAVRMIDYKTGRAKTRNEIEGKTQNSTGDYKRQLVFYKLLADSDRRLKLNMVEGEMDFVEPNQRGKFRKERFEISKEEVGELKKLIRETMKKIRNLEFGCTENHKECQWCSFKEHCWPEGLPAKKEPAKRV